MANELQLQVITSKLINVSKSLNGVSDRLSEHWKIIEKSIGDLNLGVQAWVKMYPEVEGSRTEFGYAKLGNRWGLAIIQGHDEDVQQWFITDAPRNYRVEAIERIPDLLEQLYMEANELEVQLSHALKFFEAWHPHATTKPV